MDEEAKLIVEEEKVDNYPEEESMGSDFYEGEIYAHMGAGTTNTYGYGAVNIGGDKSLEQFMMEYLSWDVIQRECHSKFGQEIPQIIEKINN